MQSLVDSAGAHSSFVADFWALLGLEQKLPAYIRMHPKHTGSCQDSVPFTSGYMAYAATSFLGQFPLQIPTVRV